MATCCLGVGVAAGRLAVLPAVLRVLLLLLLRVLLLLLRRLLGLSSSSDQRSILLAGRPLALIRLANAAKPLPYGSGKTKGEGSPLLNENIFTI